MTLHQVLAFDLRAELCSTVRIKVKASRKLKEAVRHLVARSTGLEKSRKGSETRAFFPEDVDADKVDCTWCVLSLARFSVLRGGVRHCIAHDGFHADWCVLYITLPTPDVLRAICGIA